MDQKLRMNLAELLGTFALVLAGAGAVCAAHLASEPRLDVTGIALAEGFTLAVVLTATFYVSSGCLNPALTLMLWVVRRLEAAEAVGLILMQLLGSVLAGLVLRFTFAEAVLREAHFGAPHLRAFLAGSDGRVTVAALLSGIGIEFFLTILVAVAVFSSLLDWRRPRVGGILVGLAQAAAVLIGYHLTGGAANPARWFGPVVWELTIPHPFTSPLADHTVYWVGPVLGALLGGYAYTTLILPAEKGKEPGR